MNFYSNLTISYQIGPNFGGKLTSFVAVLAQNPYVCACRRGLYYYKANIGSLGRFVKPGMGITDSFLPQPHRFLPGRSLFWRETDTLCYCSGPKHIRKWL